MPTPLPDGESRGTAIRQAYQTADFDEIHVDIQSLSDFAQALRLELSENLLPFKNEMDAVFGTGSQFALTASLHDVAEQRRTYELYLQRTRLLFDNLVEGTTQLAAAAEHIGANYGKTDDLAKLTVEDVEAALPTRPVTAAPTDPGPE